MHGNSTIERGQLHLQVFCCVDAVRNHPRHADPPDGSDQDTRMQVYTRRLFLSRYRLHMLWLNAQRSLRPEHMDGSVPFFIFFHIHNFFDNFRFLFYFLFDNHLFKLLVGLRLQFLLNTDGGYPRDAEVNIFTLAFHWLILFSSPTCFHCKYLFESRVFIEN